MRPSLEAVSRVPAVLLRADAKVELIRNLPLFELCSKRDLRRIASLAVERDLDEGSELIQEGEPGTEFFVVVEGEVDVRRRGRRVARLGAGSYVGEIALLSRSPRTATVSRRRRSMCSRSRGATSSSSSTGSRSSG